MKKYLIIGLIIILVAAGLIAYFLTKDKPETISLQKVRLNEVTRSVFYAPQYVAIAKGFMEEEGMGTVEVILIIVVLIGLVIIFKEQLNDLVNDIFRKITSQANSI